MEVLFEALILFTICGCGCTEICSVYENVPISKYEKHLEKILNAESYNLEPIGKLSIDIKLKFECGILLFNAENFTYISEIELENTANHNIYTTDDYSIYDNSILNISFVENIPPGRYKINFYYNSEINSPAVLSEWIVLTNFDDDHVDEKNSDAMRVWLRKSALGHGKYLVKNVERLLKAFENFTGFSYNKNKYVKLDLFVVPKSPKSEHRSKNFIYVDEEIFVNEDNIATFNNEKLLRSIAEMMVNQAFNNKKFQKYNLPVQQFKGYLVYYITDQATNNWHLMDLFTIEQRSLIFGEDFVFNRLNYGAMNDHSPSGGFIIRMIAHIIGETNFKALVNNFLEGRGKAGTFTFNANKISIDEEKFIEQVIKNLGDYKGHPLVTIDRNYQANSAIIKQSVFKRSSNKKSSKRNLVPLNFATQRNADFDNTTVTTWLGPEIESIEIVTPPPYEWLICNKQQFGFYRVNYDERNWKLIADYLKSGNYRKIHVLNRAQLIDDAFVLAEFGYLNFNVTFDLVRYLKVETEYVPWATFWEKMFRLYQYSSISSSQYYEPFKNMILELSGPLERKFLSDAAFDGNDRMERLNKIAFIKWTCFYGSTLCRNYSLVKLKNWLADPVEYPLLEDIRKEILCAGIRSAGKETWEKLLEKYLIDKDDTILFALMCSSNYELLNELITMFITGQLVQKNPWYFLIKIAHQSTIGLDTIIRFIDNKQDVIHSMNHFQDFVVSFCTVIEEFITNNQQLDKFKKILNDNFDTLGSIEAADHLYFAQMKVNNSTSVLNSMKAYWNVEEK
ncbi:hypothetical protein KQX54_002778 [Cotesia glomerata]|uniref:ERAP1-like C-terminal domain-containing protein n=1 Tax=Cotesia glomerata TaxID=32391 RepID=A0AAV7IC34_COTGL|nr:hypothetical protein KQX54_002778 [Cotesia glomerata]